jgi:hypothetical protein
MLFQEQRWDLLRFIVCSVLIRPKSIHKITDFGSFKKKPEQYSPAKVRFLVACIPDLTDVIINKWYSIVQKSEVANE